ncbi:enoyl-CoA hydratase/isomerase family protein [Methylocystis sp. H62]|uniref:enoyl-CoA hydratase-related protein n=1 Tax=Methylocystis sp. H62 TaxID=2785789 RepID=UPI0018C2FC2B|nr:enoyl-CoA hydratase-related protein [Methylocystis sp. H62]MBG0795027.1 enoyl-CoA hydratase/isomerase family protein [Methylocystis sp. H62]
MTTLLQSVDANGVATLTLNRPDRRNALDYELIGLLKDALEDLDARADVRIITLEGAGDYFCAGGDIGSMIRVAQRSSSANEQDALALARMLHALDTASKPTIALAKGVVVGGGVGLLACCDIVVAADDASFSLNEVRLGLLPAIVAPFLIRAIGLRQLRRYALTAERFSAAEAQKLGLVHRVAPRLEVNLAHAAIVADLLRGAPGAQADVKNFFAECDGHGVDAELLREAAHRLAARRSSAEAQEGLSAFLEKRAPRWIAAD